MDNERTKGDLFISLIKAVILSLYYIVESIILQLVPQHLRMKDVIGEVVVITGGGNGIGRELAVLFAQNGAKLALLDINAKDLEETKSLLETYNAPVVAYECDVAKREDVYAVAAKIRSELGVVNILINNAGIITGKSFLDCPDHMMQKTMEVNVMAHFWTCKAFLPDMKAANHGHIVSISSLTGYVGLPKMVDYSTSKFAAVGFEESLRAELHCERLDGIHTTVVLPFLVGTGLFKGCHFQLFDALPQKWVAETIFSGILMNDEVIILPRIFAVYATIYRLLPRKASRLLMEAAGFYQGMDNFKGRKKAHEIGNN